jgi:hypothetical protein
MTLMPRQISTLINMESPQDVLAEVKQILFMIHSECDVGLLTRSFLDVLNLFAGKYPGYQACDTQYHDLKHTTDTFLAMARIIHGGTIMGCTFSGRGTELGLLSALFHDAGYLLKDGEEGPGARHTLTHIHRSIDFMENYFVAGGVSRDDFQFCCNILNCTGLDVAIDRIQFASQENEVLGKMLGTADLLGQMADRTYLEKLPFLYEEFKIAEIEGLGSEVDFFKSTPKFFEMTQSRFQDELGAVSRYMRPHFRVRWGIDEDLYMTAIQRSMDYLETILEIDPENCREHFRRAGVIGDLALVRTMG